MGKGKARLIKEVVTDQNNRLWINAKVSGIEPFVMVVDQLSMATFSKSGPVYLRIDEVIEWHEREHRETKGEGGILQLAELLKTLVAKWERGEMDVVDNTSRRGGNAKR